MKTILLILLFSVCAFGQTDVCEEIPNAQKIVISSGSLAEINSKIEKSDEKKTLLVEVRAGTYSGEKGITIKRDNVCLSGVGKPILKRTKFSNESHEPSVIKVFGASNIVIKGFEIQGTIDRDNRNVGPIGISVVNFNDSKTEGISNIYIEDNLIHSIGQLYEYDKPDGFWRYRKVKSDNNTNSE